MSDEISRMNNDANQIFRLHVFLQRWSIAPK